MHKAMLAVAGTAIGAATQVVSATPAAADLSSCDSGEWCLYENQDYNNNSGTNQLVHQWVWNASDYRDALWFDAWQYDWTGISVDNGLSSVKNNGNSCDVIVYQHPGMEGHATYVARGDADPLLSDDNVGNNRASSHEWINCE